MNVVPAPTRTPQETAAAWAAALEDAIQDLGREAHITYGRLPSGGAPKLNHTHFTLGPSDLHAFHALANSLSSAQARDFIQFSTGLYSVVDRLRRTFEKGTL